MHLFFAKYAEMKMTQSFIHVESDVHLGSLKCREGEFSFINPELIANGLLIGYWVTTTVFSEFDVFTNIVIRCQLANSE